ncbi:hypothetical protein THIOM_002986 [Candidatus Thiomargarita nelsonii]|uniref:Uncharacterized protein n=1 Tax=Candidatus Thiomargarita nelsonii TaxID=1003181 RepID=A0A176RZM2_9GAMM|nr:hypothetical protein THIOM_002986 [Candidatus Thiomargarita nelsonii]
MSSEANEGITNPTCMCEVPIDTRKNNTSRKIIPPNSSHQERCSEPPGTASITVVPARMSCKLRRSFLKMNKRTSMGNRKNKRTCPTIKRKKKMVPSPAVLPSIKIG